MKKVKGGKEVLLAMSLGLSLAFLLPGLVQPQPTFAQQGIVYSATGSGKILVQSPGLPGSSTLYNYSFSALQGSDGITRGQFQLFAHGGTGGQDNARIHMDIICLNVSGNTADIGGIITGGNQGLLGQTASFSVVDGGEGRNAPPDEISDLNFLFPCTPQQTYPVDKGNIQVRALD